MPRPVPVLRSQLVTLQPLDPARDATDYHQMNLEPDMHLWTGNAVFGAVDEARAELERFAAMPDVTMWAIIENATQRLVGRFFICMEDRDGLRVAGEGNRVAKLCWRKGHNRETRRLVYEYVFDVLRADCIETECWTDNVNSRLSILAHGFALTGAVPEWNAKHGRMMGKSRFRLTRQQWQSAGH